MRLSVLRVVLTMPLLAAAARAGILFVPQDHATIQAAVDAAIDGDTIVIAPGTYAEAVVVTGRNDLRITGKGKVQIAPGTATGLTLTGCNGCLVQNVRVIGGSPHGILLDSCVGGFVRGCRAEGAATNGIRIDASHDVTVEGCSVRDTGHDGISLAGLSLTPTDACVVQDNTVVDAGEDGIKVNGSMNTIQRNTCTRGLDGFELDSLTDCVFNVFSDNVSTRPVFNGFVVFGTDNLVTGNKVLKSGSDAVFMGGGVGNRITGNVLKKPGFDGIWCSPDEAGPLISENVIVKPADDGIDVEADGASVSLNTVSRAPGNGFEVDGDGGTWDGNTAKGSKVDGFRLNGTGHVLTNNTAKGSKGFDLNDLAGGNTIDGTNTFKTQNP